MTTEQPPDVATPRGFKARLQSIRTRISEELANPRFWMRFDEFVLTIMVTMTSFSLVFFILDQEEGIDLARLPLSLVIVAVVLARILLYMIDWFRPRRRESKPIPRGIESVCRGVEVVLALTAVAAAVLLIAGFVGQSKEQARSGHLLLQWMITLWFFLRIGRVFWNVLDLFWYFLWNATLLSVIAVLPVGLALGWFMKDYGLVPLFWGDGRTISIWIVPMLSSFMIALTLGVLLLCALYRETQQYESALERTDGTSPGIGFDEQCRRRAMRLKRWLLTEPDGTSPPEEEERRESVGNLVWIMLRPLLFMLTLPALVPMLSVRPTPNYESRLGWIVGLVIVAFLFRGSRRWNASGTGPIALRGALIEMISWVAVRANRRGERTAENTYTGRLNASGLLLIVLPLLGALSTAHLLNQFLETDTTISSLVITLVIFLGCVILTRWRRWDVDARKSYWIGLAVVTVLAGAFSAGAAAARLYIAAPFSICWLLMGFALLATCLHALFSGHLLLDIRWLESSFVRRLIQGALLLLMLLILVANGRSGQGEALQRLDEFQRWKEKQLIERSKETAEVHIGPAAAQPKGAPKSDPNSVTGFGFPPGTGTPDREVLKAWKARARSKPADSDEVMPIARWVRPESSSRSADWTEDTAEVKPKLVIIATSGGGLRAAIWSRKVLEEIQAGVPEFFDRTRLITGSSGGMLGATSFLVNHPGIPIEEAAAEQITTAPAPTAPAPTAADSRSNPVRSIDEQISHDLERDFLTPVLHRMVFGDILTPLNQLIPSFGSNAAGRSFVGGPDRGLILENFLEQKIPRLGWEFQQLAGPELRGEIPSLVFTPTIVEDSRRCVISNLDLSPLLMNHGEFDSNTRAEVYSSKSDLPSYSLSGIQFFELFPQAYQHYEKSEKPGEGFDLAAAIRLNATFPYVTPARTLGTSPIERLVDAGYFDNYGIDLATSWLEQHRTWIEDNTSGVILIQIRAFSNERQLRRLPGTITEPTISSSAASGPATTSPGDLRRNDFQSVFRGLIENLTRGAEFLTTPFQTLERARSNINYYRNDAAIENLKRSFTFDMLQKLTGETYSSSEGSSKPSASDYSRANRFFRVFTFTCSNPRAELGDPSQTETLSWYLSESEFDYVLGNWDTIDNYRRHQYLLATFRRYFAIDDEAGSPTTSDGSGVISNLGAVDRVDMEAGTILPLDDQVRSAATNIGERYSLVTKGKGDSEPRTVVWKFTNVPFGSYEVDVNLPRYQHAVTKLPAKTTIAERFEYRIESRAVQPQEDANPSGGTVFPAVLELAEPRKWRQAGPSDLGDANPLLGRWSTRSRMDSGERRRLFDEIDQYAQLGLWYHLDTIQEPPVPTNSEQPGETTKPRLMNITITLEAPRNEGQAAIADSVRIRRRDERSPR